MKNLTLALLLFAAPLAPTVPAAPSPLVPVADGPSVPFKAWIDFYYLDQNIDPVTGHLITTGIGFATGTFGATSGPFTLDLDLLTGAFTGSRDAIAADGSSYVVDFSGQFLDAIHSVSTFTVRDGTGRFEGLQVTGNVASTEWTGGVAGDSSFATGVASL